MTTELTHWKKHLDSRYISGEDLLNELHGLKKEMIVCIERFTDVETFDQKKQAKELKTGLFLKEVNGTSLYKPVVLNATNAKFFVKETGSPIVDNWIGHPVIIYACPDSRHGHVVRFKKYALPVLVKGSQNFINCQTAIHTNGFTMDQIRKKYTVSSEVEQLLMTKPNE